MPDRSKDVSKALTEIRTVRSRAVAAIDRIQLYDGKVETRNVPASMNDDEYVPATTERFRDVDADEMVAVLDAFITATARFARKGRN